MLSTFRLHCKPPLAPKLHYIPAAPRFLNLNFSAKTISTRLFSTPSSRPAPAEASTPTDDEFGVELGRLLALLPQELRAKISKHLEFRELIEVVLDLGRNPLARFPSGDFPLSDSPVTAQDLEHASSQVGDFAVDNRAGISRTLHRISAIRNRKGTIIGLTCRVGRAVPGSANALKDLVQTGGSLLLIGPPGVGKTTIIRDIARMLANDYRNRVIIVDTSNEIGGDGDIPHAGIGNARRMQVPDSDLQHKVLIEAVENHMPQVIVIDEIGTKLEAMAASTISQRGIQLVATAHGVTIENLIMNPALEMLVGGVQNVTLGDEEANRRGVQKTVLERKGPSTFTCGVEIISKTELRVYCNLEETVDAILSGRYPAVEIRKISYEGVEKTIQSEMSVDLCEKKDQEIYGDVSEYSTDRTSHGFQSKIYSDDGQDIWEGSALNLFVCGIPEASVIQGIKKVKMDRVFRLTDNISEADALLALQSKLKKNQGIQAVANSREIPMYVTKTSSLVHLTKALQALANDFADYNNPGSSDDIKMSEKLDALEEVRIAIEQVVIPQGGPVELLPRPSHIMSLQMDLIRKYQLQCERVSQGPVSCLRILPFQTRLEDNEGTNGQEETSDIYAASDDLDDHAATNGPYFIERLPLLPDTD